MKLFLDYIKSQSIILFGYLLVCIVFITISVLATIEMEYIFLGIEILGFILFIYLIVFWFHYQKLSDVKDDNERLVNENKGKSIEALAERMGEMGTMASHISQVVEQCFGSKA